MAAAPKVQSAQAQVVAKTNGCEQYRSIIERYDWDANIMLAVMKAENRSCDPGSKNLSPLENHRVCIGSYGLLQVGCVHFSGNQDPNDVGTNISVAHAVWLKQGYNAWTQYANGEYLKYL